MAFKEALHLCTNKVADVLVPNHFPVDEDFAVSAERHWHSILNHEPNSYGERPFLGQYVMERVCEKCNAPKPRTFGTFTHLQMHILEAVMNFASEKRKAIALQDLLSAKYETTRVDADCDNCGTLESFAEIQSITRLPEYIVFEIARFVFGHHAEKIKDSLTFEGCLLELKKYVSPQTRTQDSSYRCQSIVHHRGDTMESGHYVACVREERTDRGVAIGCGTKTSFYRLLQRTNCW